MITFTHPLAPTVSYRCPLNQSIASYTADHLHEYSVYLIEDSASAHGLGIELIDKETGDQLGIVSIH